MSGSSVFISSIAERSEAGGRGIEKLLNVSTVNVNTCFYSLTPFTYAVVADKALQVYLAA